MSIVPLAVHTFDSFEPYYLSFRVGGVWTNPTPIFNSAIFGSASCSLGALTAALVNKRGLISQTNTDDSIRFSADASATNQQVIFPAGTSLSVPDFWDVSHGGWWYNGAWWALFVTNFDNGDLTAYRSTDPLGATGTWFEVDAANRPHPGGSGAPQYAFRWDPNTGLVYVLGGAHLASYSLWTLDMNANGGTGGWSAPFGTFAPGRDLNTGPGSGIVKFPNGDTGILYSDAANPLNTYYKLYAGGVWGAEILVADHTAYPSGSTYFANVQIDPSLELLHVFVYTHNKFALSLVSAVYKTVTHAGVVSADLFTFGPTKGSSDGINNGMILNGQIFVPFDDHQDPVTLANRVYVAPLGTGSFVAEYLPIPAGVSTPPSTVFMAFGDVLSIACPVINTGIVGTQFSSTLVVSGGIPPYTFALTGGSLPPGLSLNTSTGVISGTPTTPGTFPYSVQVTDSASFTASANCSITISAAIVNPSQPQGGRGFIHFTLNFFNACLGREYLLYRQIDRELLKCGVKPYCFCIEERDWGGNFSEHEEVPMGPPEGAIAFNPVGQVALPTPMAGDTTILTFRIPWGYDGVILAQYHGYYGVVSNPPVPGTFVEGSGDIVWRLSIAGRFGRDCGLMGVSIGSIRNMSPIAGGLQVRSENIIQYIVAAPNTSGALTPGLGNIVAGLHGWMWPRR